ncbi:MAG: hypothetical protein HGA49_03990 [Eubacteriaceae bacterium]|nr:hypothetical protein [Eubacteriaceae bacterium]
MTRIKEIKSSQREIRNLIRGLEGIDRKSNMQLFEGKSLKEIAYETGYSYDHIRRVASKIRH